MEAVATETVVDMRMRTAMNMSFSEDERAMLEALAEALGVSRSRAVGMLLRGEVTVIPVSPADVRAKPVRPPITEVRKVYLRTVRREKSHRRAARRAGRAVEELRSFGLWLTLGEREERDERLTFEELYVRYLGWVDGERVSGERRGPGPMSGHRFRKYWPDAALAVGIGEARKTSRGARRWRL